MTRIVFYTNPMSRGRTVRWMLEELGQPYETRVLDFANGMKEPDYLAVNPMGKVPALVHDGVIVTEAAAITAYLADTFPAAGLAPPAGDPARGPYYRWLFFAAGPMEQAMTNASAGFHVETPELRRRFGYGRMPDVLDTLEQAVTGRAHLAGDAFTAVDLYLGSMLGWGMAWGMIEKRPAFEAYVGPLLARPAAVRARGLDDALMPRP